MRLSVLCICFAAISAAIIVAVTHSNADSAQPAPQSQPAEVQLVSFRAAAVDGVDVLVLRDGNATIEHREWQPITDPHIQIHERFPRQGDFRVVVKNRVGRVRVGVIRQPRPENGFEIRVLIDDGPEAGAAPLSFDLVAVPRRRADHPCHVLLITLDSLRPDRLGCYGYSRPTSPNLDAFARQSIRFSNAFSTSSFTPPAHASLLTSRYVGDHGVLTWNAMSDTHITLAEVLAAHDYRTGASVNLGLLSEQNLGQGFEWRREGSREAREIVDDALEFLRSPVDQPFFLWLHFYDIHRPYGRSPNWKQRFGRSERSNVGDGEDHYNLRPGDVAARSLSEQDLQFIMDRYDAGIAYTDTQLAPLLAELSTPDRLKDTLIIITADHGESLLDHRERLFSHDPFLYSAVTRIPLLMRLPQERAAGRTSDAMVSLIDLAPTVLDAAGIAPPPTFMGQSLFPLLDGAAPGRSEVYMECWGWEQRKAVRTNDWLAIVDSRGAGLETFDVRADPEERRPLPAALPERAERLTKRLEAFAARPHADTEPKLDDDTRKKLRTLGYLE